MYIFSFLLWAVLSVAPIYGEDNFHLKGVSSNKFLKISKNLEARHVYVFIAPHCASCIAQIKELSCLTTPKTFISLYGTEEELYREKVRLSLEGNFYIGTQSFINSLPLKEKISPQILIKTDEGKLVHFLGLTKCTKLQQFVALK